MDDILKRFLKYVAIDTTSNDESKTIPSFAGERDLADLLKTELCEMGVEDAEVTENCFVFATVPATKGYENKKTIGLLAHLDTAPDCIRKNVQPRIHTKYAGQILELEDNVVIDPQCYPELEQYLGDDIVTSDGRTLLGCDDKAGIAIIMDVVHSLVTHPELKHGKIRIAFTPDEEVSIGGASVFDVEKFGADYGITVDGDGIGEFNYETFYAFSYDVELEGNNIHPAEAKGKMINACTLAAEFDRLLPQDMRPENTEGREGFIHLYEVNAQVESAKLGYILRDFEIDGLENKKLLFQKAAETIEKRYGEGRVKLTGIHEYSNPKAEIEKHPELIETCLKAYRNCGVKPIIKPIRGGTDGSTLADKKLACVNIFLGGHNYHNCREFVSVQAMKKSADILLQIVTCSETQE